MPLQSRVDATANTTQTKNQCSKHAANTLNKYEGVDASLFTAPSFSLDLSLLKNPIYSVRSNGV